MQPQQNPQPPVPGPSISYSLFAIEILMKLRNFGIQVLPAEFRLLSDQQYALIYPGFERSTLMSTGLAAERECRDIQLAVRYGNGEIRVWFSAPAKDTLVGMGVIGHLDDFIPHPFFLSPIPWTVEHQLQPLWNHLGITYRPATVADVFGDPTQLVCLHGQFWRKDPSSIGAFNFIVHRCIARTYRETDLINTVHAQLKKHVVYKERMGMDRMIWLPPQMMMSPRVSESLTAGVGTLLAFGRNQISFPPKSKGTLVPWD